MSPAQGATARFLIVAAGTIAAFFIADYIGLKVLGLFIPPDAQGRYTISAITPGHGYAVAISTLVNVVVLAGLVAALLWTIYARRPMDRAVIIGGGYVVACLAAALLLLVSTGIFSQLTSDAGIFPRSPNNQSSLERLASSFSIILSLGSAIGLFALLPALPVIMHTERKRIRTLRYYLIAGALTGIVSLALALVLLFAPALSAWLTGTLPSSSAQGRPGAALMVLGWALMFVPPGLGAGFTYWLIAGRNAGTDVAITPPPSELQAG